MFLKSVNVTNCSGSTLITNFIFTDLTPENENNLGVAILEWNGPVLNLRHLNDEAEKVFKIQFNRTEKTIAIVIFLHFYHF